MKRLRFNIAASRRISPVRYGGAMALALTGAFLLVWTGWRGLQHKSALTAGEHREMAELIASSGDQAKELSDARAEIDRLQKRWNGRVRFANSLITRKTRSFLEGMDLLEKSLPPTVSIRLMMVDQDHPRRLQLEIIAPAFSDLIEVYRRLSAYRLEINSEIRDRSGQYRVSLALRY